MPRRRGSAASAQHAAGLAAQRALPGLPIAGENSPAPPTGEGRGPGKLNQRIAQLLAARGYRQPWEVLAQAYSMPTKELARWLGCKPIEAWREQVKAAADLLPYTAKKLPLDVVGAIEVTDTRSDDDIAAAILARLAEKRAAAARSVENQGLIEGAAQRVGQSGVGQNERSR